MRVSVTDDGEGIDANDVPRLFTPFDRLGQQTRAKVEGTGLGLALSKRLVESMDGQIGFEQRQKGASFWFTIKRADANRHKGYYRSIVNGFNDPTDFVNFFMTPDKVDAFLEAVPA